MKHKIKSKKESISPKRDNRRDSFKFAMIKVPNYLENTDGNIN